MKLTIFTPTYNRAYTLERLYASLKKQKTYNFEWIIVDDDSTDGTTKLVNKFKTDCKEFDIIYIKQEHGGKHRAINRALDVANGEFFFIVDSDDYLTENAVDDILSWICTISNDDKFAGVSGLKVYSTMETIGGNLKVDKNSYIDANNFERNKYNLGGDKAEVYKTDIMRKHKFPEFDNEFFVTEAVCWNAIAADGYKLRWFNTPIYVCEYLEDGLTRTGANDITGHLNNIKGHAFYVKQSLEICTGIEKWYMFRNYNRMLHNINVPLAERAKKMNISVNRYLIIFVKMIFVLGTNKIKRVFN